LHDFIVMQVIAKSGAATQQLSKSVISQPAVQKFENRLLGPTTSLVLRSENSIPRCAIREKRVRIERCRQAGLSATHVSWAQMDS